MTDGSSEIARFDVYMRQLIAVLAAGSIALLSACSPSPDSDADIVMCALYFYSLKDFQNGDAAEDAAQRFRVLQIKADKIRDEDEKTFDALVEQVKGRVFSVIAFLGTGVEQPGFVVKDDADELDAQCKDLSNRALAVGGSD